MSRRTSNLVQLTLMLADEPAAALPTPALIDRGLPCYYCKRTPAYYYRRVQSKFSPGLDIQGIDMCAGCSSAKGLILTRGEP